MMDEPNPYQTPSDRDRTAQSPPQAEPGSSLDFARCFSFFFQDPDWVRKLLLGSLFTLLSVLIVGSFFLAGYMIRIIRRAARGETQPLPEWDDLGGIFVDGVAAVGVYLGYTLPAVLIFVPVAVGMSLSAAGEEPSAWIAVGMSLLAVLFGMVLLAVVLFVPSALVRLAVEQRFVSAFDVKANWDFIAGNGANYFFAVLVVILAQFASQFGILLFCIGIIPVSFWAGAVGAYAFGEVAWRDRKGRSATTGP